MGSMSSGCLKRNAGRGKTASGIIVYLNEELGDARLRSLQLKQYVAKALELVEKSNQRDHLFEVAGHIIHGMPDVLFKLEKALEAAAMAASRMDYEEIKQGLKPEKAEELEGVLEDIRLHYLKRRSSDMSRYDYRSMWASDEDSTLAGAGAEFQKQNPKITDEEAAEIDEMHEKNRDVVKDKSAAAPSEALTAFQTAMLEAKTAYSMASRGNDKMAALNGIESIQSMTMALGHIAPQHKDKLLGLGEKIALLRTVVKQDAGKADVLQRQAAYGDPYWMTAKYPGKDKNGKPFKKGEKVFYYPRTKTILTGPEAEKASREFGAMAFDEDYGFRAASEQMAEGLEDACWEGYEAYGMKPGEGGQMVPNCVPMKSASASGWDSRTAKLHRRQVMLLEKLLASGSSHTPMFFDELPMMVQKALRSVSDSETLEMDVERWLADYTFAKSRGRLASVDPVAEDWKAARFEKGVPADPTENMSEEDAAEWEAMNEANKDKFKSAASNDPWKV